MPWAAFRRRRAVAWGIRSIRSTGTPITVSGRSGGTSRGSLTLLRLLAKQHHPEPLEADRRLLQGTQQPKIPLQHLVQYAPIISGQGIPGEPCAQGLAVCLAQLHLFWALHRRLHPYEQ
jgi:hypothetical protein